MLISDLARPEAYPMLTPLALTLSALLPQEGTASTGPLELVFTERHPLGDLKVQAKRFRWPKGFVAANDPDAGHYVVEEESFKAYVPPDYNGEEPYGLLVWISPGEEGWIPRVWTEPLDEHRLIAVGADRSGNERLLWYRIALALDAVHNMPQRYAIDPERIYITGFSGGGRCASRVGIHYSDVFHGGIYQGGCNYFAELPKKSDPGMKWPAHMPKPSGKALGHAKNRSRHVLLCGTDDFNREQSHTVYAALRRKAKFRHVTWLEPPDTGHQPANAEWFGRALEALDAPLFEKRAKAEERARRKAERK